MAFDWGFGALPEKKAAKWERTRQLGKARYVIKATFLTTAYLFLLLYLLPLWIPAFSGYGSGLSSPVHWVVLILGVVWSGFARWNRYEVRYRLFQMERDGLFVSSSPFSR